MQYAMLFPHSLKCSATVIPHLVQSDSEVIATDHFVVISTNGSLWTATFDEALLGSVHLVAHSVVLSSFSRDSQKVLLACMFRSVIWRSAIM